MQMAILKNMTLALAAGLVIPAVSIAAVPHTFQGGKKAIAAEVNENFEQLDQRVSALEQAAAVEVAVDCILDPDALANTEFSDNTTYILTGNV